MGKMLGEMTVVCCICGKVLETMPCRKEYDGEVSHGLCAECMASELEKLEERYEQERLHAD